MSATLTEFLLARIAEDEQEATEAHVGQPPHWEVDGYQAVGVPHPRSDMWMQTIVDVDLATPGQIAHIARHDPARVLAECEAKRRIVETYSQLVADPEHQRRTAAGGVDYSDIGLVIQYMEEVLQMLALPYADHPDYRAEWRPEA